MMRLHSRESGCAPAHHKSQEKRVNMSGIERSKRVSEKGAVLEIAQGVDNRLLFSHLIGMPDAPDGLHLHARQLISHMAR